MTYLIQWQNMASAVARIFSFNSGISFLRDDLVFVFTFSAFYCAVVCYLYRGDIYACAGCMVIYEISELWALDAFQ